MLQFVPKSDQPTDADAPILCGLEIIAEQPGEAPTPVLAELIRGGGAKKSFMRYADIEKMTDQQKKDVEKARKTQ